MDHEQAHVNQVIAAQQLAEADRKPARAVIDHITRNDRMGRWELIAERIQKRVDDPTTDPRIFGKVARAICQRRIPEHAIARILDGIPTARKRGPYFVASIKRVFKECELDWYEEKWQ